VSPKQAFEQYHRAVFSFSYRLTRREDLAEDITQECFLALVRAPHRFDEARGNLKTYLFSIARNLALKHYRDHRAEELLDDSDVPDAIDGTRNVEVATAVSIAVASLPLLQQEALILFEYEGATLEEIAQIVAADVGTVKSRLHRARERLRRVLAPQRRAGAGEDPRRKVGNAHGTV
jgi:RNA polymerase sigma-70 factor (ECF subfamily)